MSIVFLNDIRLGLMLFLGSFTSNTIIEYHIRSEIFLEIRYFFSDHPD